VKNATEKNIALAASKGMQFLRIGANAGDGDAAKDGIALVRKYGMLPRFSLMKGYILSATELAEEAKKLEGWGLGALTIMDSAGTMTPGQVEEYVGEMKKAVSIPIGFHGHNNLGLSAANALAAEKSGAETLDAGLLGMARSAGNLATELAVALFRREGKLKELDFFGLLEFIDTKLAPAMKQHQYQAAVCPEDLILGYAGCHSNFLNLFKEIAETEKVNLYELIIKVSEKNRKNPSREAILAAAKG
jgi:4-hydroxy-2-oxovalerate aldolase